ncbi:hypothetical protein LTR85_008546 [Meristemomyces frigidus]|nr:hypothetical protein LTR85_008546 [Meristemomyces frigidus]
MAATIIAASILLAVVVIKDAYYGSVHTPLVYALSYAVCCTVALPCALAYKLLLAPHLSRLRHIPAVPQGPVLRRLLKEPNSVDFLRWLENVPNDGLLRYYGVLNGERILVTTTDGAKTIHDGDEQDFRRPSIAKAILCRLTGGGVFAAEGAHHAAQRKEMQPAFKFRHLKDLYPTFWIKTKELLASLGAFAGGSAATVEVDDWISRGTLDAISLAGFGFDFKAIAQPDSALVRKYRTAFLPGKSAARVRILANILPIKVLFNLPMKRNRDAKACISAVRDEARRVVQRRQSESAEKQQAHNDILSALLASNLSQKTDDIVSQCMAFLAAGHEASALALGWALYELSRDQTRQQTLRDEIRQGLPSPSSSATIDALQIDNLPFLEAVVTESLRLWYVMQ